MLEGNGVTHPLAAHLHLFLVAGCLHLPVLALSLRDAEHAALCQPGPQGHHSAHGQQGMTGRGCEQGPLPHCWDP